MTGRRILDSHFHIFDLSVRASYPNQNASHQFPSSDQAAINRTHLAAEAEDVMETAGVKEAVMVQCYNDCPEEVYWVMEQAKDHPFILGVVGGLDLCNLDKLNNFIKIFTTSSSPKFVGVRHLIDFEAEDFLTREDVHAGLQVLSDHNLTFDLQSYPATLKHIPLIAGKFPNLRMVIDHIAKPNYDRPEEFSTWSRDMAAAGVYPNVYCKLSGLINEIPDWSADKFQPFVDHCLKVFGAKRCMYGSDWPVCHLATPSVTYRDVVDLLEQLLESCSEEEKDDIYYRTAKRFYSL